MLMCRRWDRRLHYSHPFLVNLVLNELCSSRSRTPACQAVYLPVPFSRIFKCRGPALSLNPRPNCRVSTVALNGGEEKEILLQHLLIGEESASLLAELEQSISNGVNLTDLARQFSICPAKENGGMLGWIRRGQLVSDFEEAAFAAPLHKVLKCKTALGWHLFQVLSERNLSSVSDLDARVLHMKMQDPRFLEDAQLIDVRESHEVDQAYLNGFIVFPLSQFKSWGPRIMDVLDPQKETYVLCHHGMRSLQVAKWLSAQGFKEVFNVNGGIHAYSLEADPSIPTY